MDISAQTDPAVAIPAAETEEDKRRLRQQERTVDNLNRLFAMLFSVVFAIAAASQLQRLGIFVTQPYQPIDWETVLFNAGAMAILGTTAAIFFHQASRGLDLSYAASAQTVPHRAAFLFDYLVIVLTMIPFALMGKAMEQDITAKSGFFWFFVAHELLILFGLFLLVVKQVRMSIFGTDNISPHFRSLGVGVDRYWFIMNSIYLALAAVSFCLASESYTATPSCPLIPHRPSAAFFIFVFFCLAMLRNAFDYFWMWNVFFPVKPEGANGEQVYLPPLKGLIKYEPRIFFGIPFHFPMIFGYIVLIAAVYILVFVTRLYDLKLWMTVCS